MNPCCVFTARCAKTIEVNMNSFSRIHFLGECGMLTAGGGGGGGGVFSLDAMDLPKVNNRGCTRAWTHEKSLNLFKFYIKNHYRMGIVIQVFVNRYHCNCFPIALA
jgi:hypothetical protein